MADETSPKPEPEIVEPPPGAAAPPSREPRRDPGVIEGEATEIHEAPPPAPPTAEAASEKPAHGEPAHEQAASEQPSHAEPATERPSHEESAAEEPAAVPAADARAPRIRPGTRWASPSLLAGALGALVGVALALAAASLFDPRAGALDAANRRLAALERGAESQSAAAADFQRRLGALETNAASIAKTAAVELLDRRVAALEAEAGKDETAQTALAEARAARADAAKALAAAATGERPPAPAQGGAPALFDAGALQARVAALASELAGLKSGEADLKALDDRLVKVESALAAPKSEARVTAAVTAADRGAAAEAILAISLSERLNAGAPFAGEWGALARLEADGGELSALRPFADAGAPTLAALAASFAKIAPSVVAAATPPSGGGVMDRLLDHMRKLVRVRKLGEVAGDDAEALAARVSAALARGDLAAALDAYHALPEAARRASQDWAQGAGARQAAAVAAEALRADAVGRLAAASN
jgi:hypothetical protein